MAFTSDLSIPLPFFSCAETYEDGTDEAMFWGANNLTSTLFTERESKAKEISLLSFFGNEQLEAYQKEAGTGPSKKLRPPQRRIGANGTKSVRSGTTGANFLVGRVRHDPSSLPRCCLVIINSFLLYDDWRLVSDTVDETFPSPHVTLFELAGGGGETKLFTPFPTH